MRILLLICLLFFGANSFELKAQCRDKNKGSISPYVSPILSKAIAVVEIHLDSLKQKKRIIFVEFELIEGKRYVYLGQSNHYNSKIMKGYIVSKKELIVFYDISTCGSKLVDYSGLKKKKIKGFKNEESDVAKYSVFEPWGWKYEINDQDSLELIYKGFF
jgi:hypothetical protein